MAKPKSKAKTRADAGMDPQLRSELREFAAARPAGWDHDDWINFVAYLRDKGYETGDQEALGRELERERLASVLSRINGVGPRRVQALVDRFGTLWSLRQADASEVASVSNIPRTVAERIKQEI